MEVPENILLIFPDQWRGDWLGHLSREPLKTPNIDLLAERGVSFTQTWTPSPLCAPARGCIATQSIYDRSPVQSNSDNINPGRPTIYKLIKDSGCNVASVGKLDLLKDAMDWGLDGLHFVNNSSRFNEIGFTRGFDSAGKHDGIRGYENAFPEPYLEFLKLNGLDKIHAEDYLEREPANYRISPYEALEKKFKPAPGYANLKVSPLPDFAYCDNWVGKTAISVLEQLKDDGKPWFLTVNFSGPHEPMDVTSKMKARWNNVLFSSPNLWDSSDFELQQGIRRNYAAMLELIDYWCGEIISKLDSIGATNKTLVVFSSDHGEMLGDNYLWGKNVPHEPSLRVPLIISGPFLRNPNRFFDNPVSLLDMVATFTDILATGDLENYDGNSLKSILLDEKQLTKRYAVSGLGSWRAINDGVFKLVVGFDDTISYDQIQYGCFPTDISQLERGLFDVKKDPFHQNNLSRNSEKTVDYLTSVLKTEIQ